MAPMMVMVAGAGSGVGKSTVCLALLIALLRRGGYAPGDLAYVKPTTQCEGVQLVARWCSANGVACRGIGPVVYRQGFSYAVIDGTVPPDDLHRDIVEAVREVATGKKVVIVDGVGYPAVGSCTKTSNADVAALLGIPVIFVGPEGVGNAIDSTVMALSFFGERRVRVLGAIYNRISMEGGARHTLDNCKRYVTTYFERERRDLHLYGFLPDCKLASMRSSPAAACALPNARQLPVENLTPDEQAQVVAVEATLVPHIDLQRILDDLAAFSVESSRS
ncbi:unnamed protein product (mitochondrion) [Plasmodiophora brassicae]|uniref:CobQ/CobB/MinD/ParA nucleotide binding domain-containing protein n=1 Tax=Plasmodiophora brassicae TaxID=37360 RepID=A0A3P3Y5E6_PLABS|nr:unnamed protein product [Plasmodiophora brassicae]